MHFLSNSIEIADYNEMKNIIPVIKFKDFLNVLEIFNPSMVYFYVKFIAIILEKEELFFAFFDKAEHKYEIYLDSYKNCIVDPNGINVLLNLKNMYNNEILNYEIDKIIEILKY